MQTFLSCLFVHFLDLCNRVEFVPNATGLAKRGMKMDSIKERENMIEKN